MKLRDAIKTTLMKPFWSWGLPKGVKFQGVFETRSHTFLEDLHWLIQRYWIELLKKLSFKVWYDAINVLHWER